MKNIITTMFIAMLLTACEKKREDGALNCGYKMGDKVLIAGKYEGYVTSDWLAGSNELQIRYFNGMGKLEEIYVDCRFLKKIE